MKDIVNILNPILSHTKIENQQKRISELEAEIADLTLRLNRWNSGDNSIGCKHQVKELKAENERLGKQLEWLSKADWSDIQWLYWHSDFSDTGDYADFIAGLNELMEREL